MSLPPPSKTLSAISMAMMKTHMCHKFRDINDQTNDLDIEGKIVVVTGGNAGIGRAVATQLAKRNAIVILACRDLPKSEKVIEEIKAKNPNAQLVAMKLDLSDLDSVRACASEITEKYSQVNLLINNAGLMSIKPEIERTSAGHERHLATNHLGHFLLTLLLLKHLKKGAPSRVVCVGASAFQLAQLDLNDLNFEVDKTMGEMNLRPYSNSKLCNFLFAHELGRKLEGTGVRTYCLCPGFNNTDLFDDWKGFMGCMNRASAKIFGGTPDQGAETVLYCALSNDEDVSEVSGKAYHFRTLFKEANEVLNNDMASSLWEQTERLVGTKFSDVV